MAALPPVEGYHKRPQREEASSSTAAASAVATPVAYVSMPRQIFEQPDPRQDAFVPQPQPAVPMLDHVAHFLQAQHALTPPMPLAQGDAATPQPHRAVTLGTSTKAVPMLDQVQQHLLGSGHVLRLHRLCLQLRSP